MRLDDRPWRGLPVSIAEQLRSRAGEIVDDVVATVQAEIPAYASSRGQSAVVQEALGRVRLGVEQGLRHFVTLIEEPDAAVADQADFYRQLGRAAHDTGLGFDVMNSGYRIVARAAWRWLDGILAATQQPPESAVRLAEAVFVYADALSAYSAEGYAEAVAAAAGDRHQNRSRLAEVVLQPGHGTGALRDAASRAGWTVPATVVVVALGLDERANEIAGRIDADVLAGSTGNTAYLVIPSPSAPGRRTRVERALAGHAAAIGLEVPIALASQSMALAQRLLDREVRIGLDHPAAPARVDEHLVELLLTHDHELLNSFIERRLAPLHAVAGGLRARLSDTLLAWLRHNGSAPKAGAELNAHTQTVRYRLSQIRELFPNELEDPDARFELELALRAERFLRDAHPAGSQ